MKNVILLGVVLCMSGQIFAQHFKSEVFTTKAGAINGYDPVAYFSAGKAVKGNPKFTFNWNDANWYFSSDANLKAFKANPEKYAPQYGGYCAYGLSFGHKASTEPEQFSVVNGKLYLNHDKDVKMKWVGDQRNCINKANSQWQDIKDKPEE